MVREWDLLTASSDEIEALLSTLNASLAVDLPDDPRWRSTLLREYLTETMPGERRIAWVAEEQAGAVAHGGQALGHADILLLGNIGVIEILVHPGARRRAVGRALLAEAARRVFDEGFSSLGVEVVGGTPAVGFYESMGFRQAYVETRSVLDLAAVDWPTVEKMAHGADAYRVEYFPGGPPDDLIDGYARAKAEGRDEDGDLDLRPSSHDPQRLRDSLATLHRRGLKPHIVLAIHEETGEVAGLTEVVVPAQRPHRADQYDTLVVPAHADRGVDRAIKARMLCELRIAEPELTQVQTWNATAHDPLQQVNADLGFRPDREWCEYEADVAELIARLRREQGD